MRVLIVDDHPLFRKGVAAVVSEQKDFTVCGEADNAQDALSAFRELKPDLVTLDISMPADVVDVAPASTSIDSLRDAVDQNPEDWAAHRALAEALLEEGKRDDGIRGLETTRNNQLVVKPTLQTSRDDRIFAIGDCAFFVPQGESRLDDAIQAYERGSHLKRHCESKLAEARLKVERISFGPGGEIGTEPMDRG